MSAGGPVWIATPKGRGERLRRADLPVPQELSVEALRHRAIWERWVRGERQAAGRGTLLKEAADAGIEAAEAACDLLLREGWIERRERLQGGSWQWDRVVWRDLERLQRLLGVAGRQQRETERRDGIADAKEWLRGRADTRQPTALDADLLDELTRAMRQLESDGALPLETLRLRLALLRAVADWHDRGEQGMRRDFALRALGDTKALGAADWRWLEAAFDLERLRVAQFAPMLWMAGEASLWWGERRIDLSPLHCLGVPLEDVARTEAFGPVARYWLIENRASFERQARGLSAGRGAVVDAGAAFVCMERGGAAPAAAGSGTGVDQRGCRSGRCGYRMQRGWALGCKGERLGSLPHGRQRTAGEFATVAAERA